MPAKIRRDEVSGQIYDIGEMLHEVFDSWIKEGRVVETARDDLQAHADRFIVHDGAIVDNTTGFKFDIACEKLLSDRLHWQPGAITDDEERAFGKDGTLTARGAYLKKHGQAKYDFEMKRWGASPSNLTPGKRPNGEDKTTTKPAADPITDMKSNPFRNFRDKDGKINPKNQARVVEMIRSLGSEKTAAIAAAAGMNLSGLPLRVKA
jgi:hypothetical protein